MLSDMNLDGKKTYTAVAVAAAALVLYLLGAIEKSTFETILSGSGIWAVFGLRDAINKK